MFGCLRSIITFAVTVLAIIGLNSIGGVDYIKNLVNNHFNQQNSDITSKAQEIADFSKVPKEYHLTKAVDLFGVKAVLAQDEKTNQMMVFTNPAWAVNLSKDDIRSKTIDTRLKDLALKFEQVPIKLADLKITKKGFFKALDQNIPYVKVKIELNGNPPRHFEGIIGVADKPDKKNNLLISFNEPGKYNQQVAEKFFKNVKFK